MVSKGTCVSDQAENSVSSDSLLRSPRPGREPDPGLTGPARHTYTETSV